MKFRRVPKAIHKALKDEVQEIKALTDLYSIEIGLKGFNCPKCKL